MKHLLALLLFVALPVFAQDLGPEELVKKIARADLDGTNVVDPFIADPAGGGVTAEPFGRTGSSIAPITPMIVRS